MLKHDYNSFFYAIKKYQEINPDFSNCLDLGYAEAISANIRTSRDRAILCLNRMTDDDKINGNVEYEKYAEIIKVNEAALDKIEVAKQRFLQANQDLTLEENCIRQMLSGLDTLIKGGGIRACYYKAFLESQFNGGLIFNSEKLKTNEKYIDIYSITTDANLFEINQLLNEGVSREENKVYFLDRKNSILFPHLPNLNDVNQGAMGDCYMVACIAGIVENDPEYLQKMMKDNGDGTVTVKLHGRFGRINGQDRADERNVVTYIRMSKMTTTLNAKGPLWLAMLEKAFTHFKAASGGFSVNKACGVEAGNISYVSMGGNLSDIFYMLTGNYINTTFNNYNRRIASQNNRLSNYICYSDLSKVVIYDELDRKIDSAKISRKIFSSLVKEVGILTGTEAAEKIIKFNASNIMIYTMAGKAELITALSEINLDDFKEIERRILRLSRNVKRDYERLSNEKKIRYLSRICLYLNMHRGSTIRYIENLKQDNLCERPLSGNYSEKGLEVYNNLARALAEKKIITTAGLAIERDEKTETDVGGIYLNHAYTILGLEQCDCQDENGKKITLRFVKLRNPWGRAFMTYLYDKNNPTGIVLEKSKMGHDGAETKGITFLELNDYMRLFSRYTISELS